MYQGTYQQYVHDPRRQPVMSAEHLQTSLKPRSSQQKQLHLFQGKHCTMSRGFPSTAERYNSSSKRLPPSTQQLRTWHVVLLKHHFHHLFTRFFGAMCRLSEHHRVLFGIQAHLASVNRCSASSDCELLYSAPSTRHIYHKKDLLENMLPERFYGLPIRQNPVFKR